MLERHKVEVDELSRRPDFPVGQDYVHVVLWQVRLDILDAKSLQGGYSCDKNAEEARCKEGLIQRHLGHHRLRAWCTNHLPQLGVAAFPL